MGKKNRCRKGSRKKNSQKTPKVQNVASVTLGKTEHAIKKGQGPLSEAEKRIRNAERNQTVREAIDNFTFTAIRVIIDISKIVALFTSAALLFAATFAIIYYSYLYLFKNEVGLAYKVLTTSQVITGILSLFVGLGGLLLTWNSMKKTKDSVSPLTSVRYSSANSYVKGEKAQDEEVNFN